MSDLIQYGGARVKLAFSSTIVKAVAGGDSAIETGNIGSSFNTTNDEGWEDISVLYGLISSASNGAIIDVSGRGFAIVNDQAVSDPYLISGKSVEIRGAHINLGQRKSAGSWTACTDGLTYYRPIYTDASDIADLASASNKLKTCNTIHMYLVDYAAAEQPRLHVDSGYTSSIAEQDPYRLTWNSNWTQLTGLGDNFTSVTLSGADKTKFESAIAGMDNVQDCILQVRSNPANVYHATYVESYDSGTGVLVTHKMANDNVNDAFFDFQVCQNAIRNSSADVSLPEAGTYIIDLKSNRVFYRPVSASTLSSTFVPHHKSAFRLNTSAGTGLTLRNCEIWCGSSDLVTGNLNPDITNVITAVAGGSPSVTLDACVFKRNNTGVAGFKANMTSCLFDQMANRGAVLFSGSTIDKCMFVESEMSSNVRVDGAGPTLEQTTFTNNLSKVQFGVHGQALSLYKGSWRNATVFGNIFYRCEGAYSAQDSGILNTDSAANEYVWSNNLVIHNGDRSFTYDQPGIAIWNGLMTTGGTLNATPLSVEVRNNSAFTTLYESNPVRIDYSNASTLDGTGHTITHAGNSIGSAYGISSNPSHVTIYSYDNIQGDVTYSTANQFFGMYDAGQPGDMLYSDGGVYAAGAITFSSATNAVEVVSIQDASTSTVSSRSIGIDWSLIPTIAQVDAIFTNRNVRWANTYTPQSLPAAISDPDPTNASQLSSQAVTGEDYRAGWPLEISATNSLWFGELGLTSTPLLNGAVGDGFYDRNGDTDTPTSPLPADPVAEGFIQLYGTGTVFRVGTSWRMDIDYNTGSAYPTTSSSAWNASSSRRMEVIGQDNVRYTYDLSDSFYDTAAGGVDWFYIGASSPSNAIDEPGAPAVHATILNDYSNNWFNGTPASNGGTIKIAFYLL